MAAAAAPATTALSSSAPASRLLLSGKELVPEFVPKSPKLSSLLSLSAVVPSPRKPVAARRRRRPRKRSAFELPELLREDDAPILLRWRRLLRLAVLHGDAELTRAVHAAVAKKTLIARVGEEDDDDEDDDEDEVLLMNSLISAYVKLGEISDARQVFEGMRRRDVVSYTCLISAYAKSGESDIALELFLKMQLRGIYPNAFTLVAIFTSCVRQPDPHLGSQLHAIAIKLSDQSSNVHVQNALMASYVGSGRLDRAEEVFERMENRDAASWNTVISGMVKQGMHFRALQLFQEMRKTGLSGDSFTLSCLISAAVEGGSAAAAAAAHGVHAHAVKMGLELELSVGNSLIVFYTMFGLEENVVNLFDRMPERDVISWNGIIRAFMVFGSPEKAMRVFRRCPVTNGISYNTVIAGFLQNGEASRALQLFMEMVEGGVEISAFTLSGAIAAVGMLGAAAAACEQIHAFAAKSGGGSGDWVAAALLDMYATCGRLDSAEKIFRRWEHEQSRAIAFTSLISGYSDDVQLDEALNLFRQMQIEIAGGLPAMDRVTLTAALRLCGELGYDAAGVQLHGFLCKSGGLFADTQVGNSLLSMYAKSGDLENAVKVFNSMPDRDIVSWNALISAHLLHRRGDEALSLWRTMEQKGVEPDSITFGLLVSACKFAGQSSTGELRRLLELAPSPANYATAVDAMGFSGELEQAAELARSSPESHRAWRALLRRCSAHGDAAGLLEEAARRVLDAEPENAAAYILVSNLYASAGRWGCAEEVRKEMKEKGLRKRPVRSWVIGGGAVESFYARDRTHEKTKDMYACLQLLISESMKHGYEPDTRFVLQEAEEFQKRDFVFSHSAKLAAAYGHMAAPPGRPIRVVKNVRLCGDCHSFLKVFSVIAGREVLLRDTSGFHRFRDGCCSCGDRW